MSSKRTQVAVPDARPPAPVPDAAAASSPARHTPAAPPVVAPASEPPIVPIVMPHVPAIVAPLTPEEFERRVQNRQQMKRVDREAERRLDAEENPPPPWPEFQTLRQLLAEEDQDTPDRIEGWFPADGRGLLVAQFKAGKTTLVANLCRSLLDGDPWLGEAAVTPIEGGWRVMVIDAEMSKRQLKKWYREQSIQDHDRLELVSLKGRLSAFNILDPTVRAWWAARLRARQVRFLVLDCLRPFLDALGLNEKDDAGRFLVAFDALLVDGEVPEALVVHHMGHGSDRARGDSRLRDWPDVEWRLTRENDDPASARSLTAYGRDIEQPAQRLEYNDAWRQLTLGEGGSQKNAAADHALPAILAFLAEQSGPVSQNKVEEAMKAGHGLAHPAVRDALRAGVQRKTIRFQPSQGRGRPSKYFLPPSVPTPLDPTAPAGG